MNTNGPIPRKPRSFFMRGGYKLTVLKANGKWLVLYVASVDNNHAVWDVPLPGATTTPAHHNGVKPFDTWEQAMAHAGTLRTYYGDQCRGDYLIWSQQHPTAATTSSVGGVDS